jgi:xanthine dehydrogenase YagT iron-sulfur-binding subunit
MSTESYELSDSPSLGSAPGPSRRTFIATTTDGSAAVAGDLITGTSVFGVGAADAAEAAPGSQVSLTMNGKRCTVTVGPAARAPRADRFAEGLQRRCLRHLHRAGRRPPGQRCLTPAVRLEGAEVTTIEGLVKAERLQPWQQAFVDQDAFQ